jgi:hypothetical protein
VVANSLERVQYEQEGAGGEVGEQPAPGSADGDAHCGDQGGERGGFDAEITEDADHQHDVEGHRDGRSHVAGERRVDLLLLHRARDDADDDAYQPAADDPGDDGAEDLDADGHQDGAGVADHFLQVHGRSLGWGERRRW